MKICVFGGHYGSEGKGAAAEWWIRQLRASGSSKIAAFGENSPNSGHTCSKGKTKNIPASAFFADVVVLGPDSVIDIDTLTEDLKAVRLVNPDVQVYLHEHAAWMTGEHKHNEKSDGLVSASDLATRIGSTASGSGKARSDKYQLRDSRYIVQSNPHERQLLQLAVRIVNRFQWMHLVTNMLSAYDWIFECSQGVLLDTNWGTYPYVTSRSTLPQAAIHRNGLGAFPWKYAGVYRTYPIRTGGNSGPTGGKETNFEAIGVEKEIATVTKRIRRVFEFSASDFELSLFLTQPNMVMFTHADYLMASGEIASTPPHDAFYHWLIDKGVGHGAFSLRNLYVSFAAGDFHQFMHGDMVRLHEETVTRDMAASQ